MNRVIFVGFDSEQKAYEGARALHDMHREGTLTLYNDAVVVKEAGGKVVVRRLPDPEPIGTFGGMVTGGLIGMLGGPVGAAVGFSTGTLMGAAFDPTEAGIERDFVDDMGARLAPGRPRSSPRSTDPAGAARYPDGSARREPAAPDADANRGRVCGSARAEAAQRELAGLEAEKLAQVTTAQTEKARKQAEKLQAKIDAAQRRVREKEDELAAKTRAIRDEGNQKIAMLEAQKATAAAESKGVLANRLADLRGEYEDRTRRLQEALNRRKAAHATPRHDWSKQTAHGAERRFYVGTAIEILVGAGCPRRDRDRAGCLRVRVAAGRRLPPWCWCSAPRPWSTGPSPSWRRSPDTA